MKNKASFLSEYLTTRANFVEIIILGVIIALGVNLISNTIMLIFNLSAFNALILGIMLCVLSISYFGYRLLNVGLRYEKYEALFAYLNDENKLLAIPRYEYSYDLSAYFDAAFGENLAFKVLWDNEPLSNKYEHDEEGKVIRVNKLASLDLIKQATEYFILTNLSTHLTDYFNDEIFKKENLKTFSRNDIPTVLLTNKFLELFSKPMSERLAFVDDTATKSDGKIVAQYSKGAIYELFDLVLPKESKINRSQDRIEIETSRFLLIFEIHFEGFNSIFPEGFEQYFLGIEDIEKVTPFHIEISVSVMFKLIGFFSRTGWEYYKWIDSFLETLEQQFSSTYFFGKIGWEKAFTLIKCNKMTQNK